MKAGPSSPADTRTMGIVHSALQRDLTRASDALKGPPVPGDAQRAAIAQHVQAMMEFLHVHHRGEDAWLWPTMRRLNPSASALLDQMEDDHLAIAPHMEKVTSAAADYEKSAAGREALASALSELRGSLDPHLRRDEDDMMLIVATTLTTRQWDDWEQEYYLSPRVSRSLAWRGIG